MKVTKNFMEKNSIIHIILQSQGSILPLLHLSASTVCGMENGRGLALKQICGNF